MRSGMRNSGVLSGDALFELLARPFPSHKVRWRVQRENEDGSKGQIVAYIEARDVMDRLDEVVGWKNWKDEYEKGPNGGLMCRLSIRIDGEWITKSDGADNTDLEAVKGGFSDAFKRAAVKMGIGRYLYDLPAPWVDLDRGVILEIPELPDWALPEEELEERRKRVKDARQQQKDEAGDAQPADPQQGKQETEKEPERKLMPAPEMNETEEAIVRMIFNRLKQGGDPNGGRDYTRRQEHLSDRVKEFVLERIDLFEQQMEREASEKAT